VPARTARRPFYILVFSCPFICITPFKADSVFCLIEFYRDKENQASCFGYFVYNNALILPDYGFGYDEDEEKWFCDDYDEDAHPDANDCTEIDICKDIIDEEMKRCNELCGENTCDYVYALVDYNDIPENAPTEFEHFSFIQVKNEDYKSALKAIVNYER